MKRTAVVMSALVLLASQAFGGAWTRSLPAALKKAKDSKQLIFVDMFADWCGWCHRMEQEVFPSAVFQKATDDMVLLRLNTEDGGEGTKLAQQFQVTSLPTFLLLTPDMMVAGVIRGYATAPEFVKTLELTETKYRELGKLVKQEASFTNDYAKRLEMARAFTQHFGLTQSETRLKKLVSEKGAPPSIRDHAYYELAVTQVLQKRLDDATRSITAFGKVQNKGEPYERARVLQGQIYLQQGNLLAAANEFRSFKANFPKSAMMRTVEIILPDVERRLAKK